MTAACDDIRAGYEDVRDDGRDASTVDRGAIDAHLTACADCRRWFERQARLDADLRELAAAADRLATATAAAGGAADERGETIAIGNVGRARRLNDLTWASRIAAAVALAAGLTWLLLPRSNEPAPRAVVEDRARIMSPDDAPPLKRPAAAPVRFAAADSPSLRVEMAGRWAVRWPSSDPSIRVVWLYESKTSEQTPPTPPEQPPG